ncbi:MAG: hypothetical protein WAM82_28230 [Thermoanaerobaculia bacterium]
MSDDPQSSSAFSQEYRALLRTRDEPDTAWGGDAPRLVAILSTQGGFGLFRPWQSPQAGDLPLAVFGDLMDARLAAVAHAVTRRTRHYKLREPATPLVPDGGYAVFRDGALNGWLQAFDPEWIDAMNVLVWIAQWAEGLAEMLDLAGPTLQGELGEILGRSFQTLSRSGPPGDAPDEETWPDSVRPGPPDEKGKPGT